MNFLRRPAKYLWIFILVASLVATFRIHAGRVERVDRISGLHATRLVPDVASPTGYAGGLRRLVVPAHNEESYQWILQAELMLTEGRWRLRHAAYDNAPDGRPIESPSPCRWWLASLAWIHHRITHAPVALSVEWAALWAEPAMHLLAIAVAGMYAASVFGAAAASLLAIAMTCAFPFAGMFVAGAPEDTAMTQVMLLASLLLLVAGARAEKTSSSKVLRRFCGSGVFGGLALWLNPSAAVPILAAVGLGGLAATRRLSVASEKLPIVDALPWRTWGLAGSVTVLAGYLIEFAPDHLAWQSTGLVEVHPLYAVAWAGLGETVHRLARRLQGGSWGGTRLGMLVGVLALAAIIALPIVMILTPSTGFLTPENFAQRLTGLGDGISAPSLRSWLARDGATAIFWSTVLPLLLVVVAFGQWVRGLRTGAGATTSALMLVPALVATGFACVHLSWWAHLGTVTLALIVALVARGSEEDQTRLRRRATILLAAAVVLPGAGAAAALTPSRTAPPTPADMRSLIERDIAHWLAARNGDEPGIILAPPALTTALIFHGAQRGIGTVYRENAAGFAAAIRLCAASSADEAKAIAERRAITQIVMPTWDPFLDQYATLGARRVEDSLVGMLRAWLPPLWLEPVAYEPPRWSGYANELVLIFEMTELQDHPTSWSRMAEYFLDMGDVPLATELCTSLHERYGEHLGGMVAAARTAIARRDQPAFADLLATIVSRIDEGEAEMLPWDRRVSLCLVLSVGQRHDLARNEAEFCMGFAGPREWRRLPIDVLAPFMRLCDGLGLKPTDPALLSLIQSRLSHEAAKDP